MLAVASLAETVAMLAIDLNADVGEGTGNDETLLSLVTSANISCGFHAGGLMEAAHTIIAARQRGVVIGAHPGYADREHFGRRELSVQAQDVYLLAAYQIAALASLAEALETQVRYVKPHGALYHQLARQAQLADAFVQAVSRWGYPIVGLPNSQLEHACQGRLPFIREGFADRRYQSDGTLVPRQHPHALINDPQEAAEQAEQLIQQFHIRTLCLHADTPAAVTLALRLRQLLAAKGYTFCSFVDTRS
jgi:UPF0271 protein